MNQFLFSHLPYAMSGAGAWLSPDTSLPAGPMTVTGTTVPQNTWNGMNFTMPALPKPKSTTAAVPAAPKITTPGGFGNNPWPASMFQPIGQKSGGSWAQPAGPAPAGYGWDASLGYYAPLDYFRDPVSGGPD